jgi:hypothetical protein
METQPKADAPPIKSLRELFNEMPGETVLKYEHNSRDFEKDGLEFAVNRLKNGEHFGYADPPSANAPHAEFIYEARTPYRAIVYHGATPEAAIGALLLDVSRLSRAGHFNPTHPDAMGSPPVQHAMAILSERLTWFIDRRHEELEQSHANSIGHHGADENTLQKLGRLNEVIAALGTSIAALARAKDI